MKEAIALDAEGGRVGSISQSPQSRLMSQSERDWEVPINTTTTRRIRFNVTTTRPRQLNQHHADDANTSPRRQCHCGEEENSEQFTEMCPPNFTHNITTTNIEDPRQSTQHISRQLRQHAEIQQQLSRNDHNHYVWSRKTRAS